MVIGTFTVPQSVVALCQEGLTLHAAQPISDVYGMAVAKRLVTGSVDTQDVLRLVRFHRTNARQVAESTQRMLTPTTNCTLRSFLLHGAEAGRAWAEGAYREAKRHGVVGEESTLDLLEARPEAVYERFAFGAWRWEFGLTPQTAATFVEDYQRTHGGATLNYRRAFQEAGPTVSLCLTRRYTEGNPLAPLLPVLNPDPWAMAAAASPHFQVEALQDDPEQARQALRFALWQGRWATPGARVPPLLNEAQAVALASPQAGLESPPGWLLHVTTLDTLRSTIADGQLTLGARRDERSCWTDKPGSVWQFAPEHGRPVVVRAKEDGRFEHDALEHWYATVPIPVEALEVHTLDGWVALGDLAESACLLEAVKDPRTMSAAAINKELDKLEAQDIDWTDRTHINYLKRRADPSRDCRSLLTHALGEDSPAALFEAQGGRWYHGDPSRRTSFAGQNMDRDRRLQSLNSNGPGIYWTKNRDEAHGYARPSGYVHSATIDIRPSRLLLPTTKPTAAKLKTLIGLAPKEKREIGLGTWGYDPGFFSQGAALQAAITAYVGEENFLNAAVAIQHDFYTDDPNAWAAAMVKLGYDAYQPPDIPHLVVYNPATIRDIEAAAMDDQGVSEASHDDGSLDEGGDEQRQGEEASKKGKEIARWQPEGAEVGVFGAKPTIYYAYNGNVWSERAGTFRRVAAEPRFRELFKAGRFRGKLVESLDERAAGVTKHMTKGALVLSGPRVGLFRPYYIADASPAIIQRVNDIRRAYRDRFPDKATEPQWQDVDYETFQREATGKEWDQDAWGNFAEKHGYPGLSATLKAPITTKVMQAATQAIQSLGLPKRSVNFVIRTFLEKESGGNRASGSGETAGLSNRAGQVVEIDLKAWMANPAETLTYFLVHEWAHQFWNDMNRTSRVAFAAWYQKNVVERGRIDTVSPDEKKEAAKIAHARFLDVTGDLEDTLMAEIDQWQESGADPEAWKRLVYGQVFATVSYQYSLALQSSAKQVLSYFPRGADTPSREAAVEKAFVGNMERVRDETDKDIRKSYVIGGIMGAVNDTFDWRPYEGRDLSGTFHEEARAELSKLGVIPSDYAGTNVNELFAETAAYLALRKGPVSRELRAAFVSAVTESVDDGKPIDGGAKLARLRARRRGGRDKESPRLQWKDKTHVEHVPLCPHCGRELPERGGMAYDEETGLWTCAACEGTFAWADAPGASTASLFGESEDKGSLTKDDLAKLDAMDANKDWPDKAEDGKAFVVLWADGRGIARFPTKAAVRAWARKTGEWADIAWIRYQEPTHKGKKLREAEGTTTEAVSKRRGAKAGEEPCWVVRYGPGSKIVLRNTEAEAQEVAERLRALKHVRTVTVTKVEESESIRDTPSGAVLQETKDKVTMPNDLESVPLHQQPINGKPVVVGTYEGFTVVLVDSDVVKREYDMDFTEGGNHYRYSFIPAGEVWIDAKNQRVEARRFALFHEVTEAKLMRDQGLSYGVAHTRANATELALRQGTVREGLEGAWPMTTGPLSQWQKDVIAKATRVGAVRLFRENHEWIITRSTAKARRKWWRITAYENGKPWGHREYPDLETMLRHFKHTDAILAGGPLEATTSGTVGGFADAVLGEPAPRRLRRRARRHVPARTRVHESDEWKDLRWAWIDPAGKVYRLTGPAQHAAFAEERGDDENGLESKGWLKLTNFDWLPGLMALATRRRRLTHAQQRVVLDWHVDNDRHIPRWVTIAVED